MALIKDIFEIMEEIAPSRYAAEWDNVGLQLGDPRHEVRGIMVSLDASLAALKEAASKNINLLITHHPFLFSPAKKIDLSTPRGKIIREAIAAGITIFSAHTNLDSTRGGINDMLAGALGLKKVSPLEALPSDDGVGMGRIGSLDEAQTLGELARMIKECFRVDGIKALGNMEKKVRCIALCGGSGGSLVNLAARKGADLYISGDINYHQARDAEDVDLSVIDMGHFSSEKIVVKGLVDILKEKLRLKKIEVPLAAFCGEKEPFVVL